MHVERMNDALILDGINTEGIIDARWKTALSILVCRYQIAGMANRTTLVDNNTWNNSHIALVGKAMSSNETAAYEIMRELDVDYVLGELSFHSQVVSDAQFSRCQCGMKCVWIHHSSLFQ